MRARNAQPLQVDARRPTKSAGSHAQSPMQVLCLLDTPLTSFSLVPAIGKGSSDPFNATALPLTPEYAELLRFAADFSTKLVWPTEASLRKSQGPLLEANIASYRACFSTTATMHGLFAYSWSWLARLNPELAPTYRQRADKHFSDAVGELQGLLASNQSVEVMKAMVQATVYLACVESHRSHFENTMMHLNASKRMLDLVGGLLGLHWVNQEAIISVFVTFAGNTRTRPALHPDEWDPGSLAKQKWWQRRQMRHLLLKSSSSTPTDCNLVAPVDRPRLSDTLSSILAALRELVTIEALKLQQAKDPLPDVNLMFRWSVRRRYAVRGRILLYWCDLTESMSAVDPPTTINPHTANVKQSSIEICLCWAARLFELALLEELPLSTGTWIRQVHAVHATLLECVRELEICGELEIPEPDSCSDLLWVYSIGACVEQRYLARKETERDGLDDFDLRGANATWFLTRFTTLADELRLDTVEDISAMLARSYVYSPTAQGIILKKALDSKRMSRTQRPPRETA